MPYEPYFLTGPNKKTFSALQGFCDGSACDMAGKTSAGQPGIPTGENFRNFSHPPQGSRVSDNKLSLDMRYKFPVVGNGYLGYIPGKRDGEPGLGKAPFRAIGAHLEKERDKNEYRGLQMPRYTTAGRHHRSVAYFTKPFDMNYFDRENVKVAYRLRRSLEMHPNYYCDRSNHLLIFDYLRGKHREYYLDRLGGAGVRRIKHFHFPDSREDISEVKAYKYGNFPRQHFTDSSVKGLVQSDCGSQKI